MQKSLAPSPAGCRPAHLTTADLPLTALQRQQVQQWESFLDGASNRERLMSRYLFEHLFLGHLFFEADATASRLPPGAFEHATRRDAADHRVAPALRRPRVARFWYRLVPEREVILAKTHMPYGFSPARMDKYRGWFLGPEVQVSALPSYAVEVASNPFEVFRELPIDGRYRFLLDEAQFFIMNFIKGPVCRGQMAVDVIEDQFWVVFVEPKATYRGERRAGGAAPGREPDAAGRNGQRRAPARARG